MLRPPPMRPGHLLVTPNHPEYPAAHGVRHRCRIRGAYRHPAQPADRGRRPGRGRWREHSHHDTGTTPPPGAPRTRSSTQGLGRTALPQFRHDGRAARTRRRAVRARPLLRTGSRALAPPLGRLAAGGHGPAGSGYQRLARDGPAATAAAACDQPRASRCATAIRRCACAFSKIAWSGGTGRFANAAASSCPAICRASLSRDAMSACRRGSVRAYCASSAAEPPASARSIRPACAGRTGRTARSAARRRSRGRPRAVSACCAGSRPAAAPPAGRARRGRNRRSGPSVPGSSDAGPCGRSTCASRRRGVATPGPRARPGVADLLLHVTVVPGEARNRAEVRTIP